MQTFNIPAIVFKQRPEAVSPKFALFSAPVGEVKKWAAIRRRHQTEDGPQRRLNKAKINSINRFFNDPRNTIAPAITVTLEIAEEKITDIVSGQDNIKNLEINIPDGLAEENYPGVVIDGQHRLNGIAAHDPDYKINIVALLNVEDSEKAFQFLVINNKVTRVPTDLIRTLALDYQDEALKERLKTARLSLKDNLHFVGIAQTDSASPFAGHLTLDSPHGDEEDRFIRPGAIEASISVIQKKKVKDLADDDALCDFFFSMWSVIKEEWSSLWNADSKLLLNIGITALTSYLTDILIAKYDWEYWDVTDSNLIQENVKIAIRLQDKDFWGADWNIRINDSINVRNTIVESLIQIARNIRNDIPWSEDIDVVVV